MDFLDNLAANADSAASAALKFRHAFSRDNAGEDQKAQDAASKFAWQPIALALGGVVVAAVVLRLVFKR